MFKKRAPGPVREAYIACMQQSRNPYFYAALGVPDTLDGRFEMLLVHLFLLQQRLHAEAPEFAQGLSELFLNDMDIALRELGIADSGVSRRIKQMGKAYHGRLQAYATADDEALKGALARNLYGTVAEGDPAHLAGMAAYMRGQEAALAAATADSLTGARYVWPAVAA